MLLSWLTDVNKHRLFKKQKHTLSALRTEYYKLGPAFHREASPAFTEVLSEWWQISCSNISRKHLHLPLQLWDHQCCITVPVAAFNH